MQKTKYYLIQSYDNLQIAERQNPVFNTFKNRSADIKAKFNHVFKPRLNFDNYPNIEKLSFEPKN